MIGQTVSHYRVVRKLGGGGMGVVYEAEDTRLGRKVALKFLPGEHLPERGARERFEREARAASALSHPHICTVFDVGEHEGKPFIAMELLDGETLQHRITGPAIDTDHLLGWGIQIADALDATHAKGIVHRDVKPGNVFITARGDAKVLDFGLAKQAGPLLDLDPQGETATAPEQLTHPGATPGTIAYMSPEQTTGKPLDGRTDLFSLGVVLYEMATRRRPFEGDTAVALAHEILTRTPPSPLLLNPRLPEELARIIAKCLEKDRDLRYQSARDLLADLRRVQRDRSSGERPTPGTDVTRRRLDWRWLAVAALVAVAALGAWFLRVRGRLEPSPASAVRIVPFTTDGGLKLSPRLSPDGERVAYAWSGPSDDNWDIYVKSIGLGSAPLRLTQDADSDWRPVWSPDGRQIAFVRETASGGAIYTVPALGGQERKLIDIQGPVWRSGGFRFVPSFSWSPNGLWLAVAEKPAPDRPVRVVRVALATLERTPLTNPPETSQGDSAPAISPDGRTLAFVRESSSAFGSLDVWVQPLDTGDARQLTFGRYDFCGHLTWMPTSDEIVFTTGDEAVPGRIFRIKVDGNKPELVSGVGDAVAFATTGTSRMVYAKATRTPVEIWRMPGRAAATWGGTETRLVSSSQDDFNPAYSPDGRRIAFQSMRSGGSNIWVSDALGAKPVQLTALEPHAGSPSWSPDGRRIAFDSLESGNYEVYVMDAEGGVPRRLTREQSSNNLPTFSRDGRFIYFSSDRSGRREIWRIPADGGPAAQVTRRGGTYGVESWDGRHLYYRASDSAPVLRTPVSGGDEVEVLRLPSIQTTWALSRNGIYYTTWRWLVTLRRAESTQSFLDFESGRVSVLLRREGHRFPISLTVSPDERWILQSQVFTAQSELMLVENFR